MGFWGGFGEERKRGKREIETDASGRPSLLPRPLCTYLPREHPPCLSLLRPPLPLPRLPITRPLPPPSPASVLASCNAPSLGSPLLPTFLLGLHPSTTLQSQASSLRRTEEVFLIDARHSATTACFAEVFFPILQREEGGGKRVQYVVVHQESQEYTANRKELIKRTAIDHNENDVKKNSLSDSDVPLGWEPNDTCRLRTARLTFFKREVGTTSSYH